MFNFEKNGDKVAVINNSSKRQRKVYFNEDTAKDIEGKEIIEIKDGEFMISPDKMKERTTMYIFGSAGSGKSYFMASYLVEYNKTFKNNPVFLISEQDEDKAFDKLDFVKRIDISDMASNPIEWKEFIESPCCVVFDDIDSISNKKLSNAVELLRDQLLKNARKFGVSVISSSHEGCEGRKTKAVLNESKIIVFFMMNYNRSLKYLLENYLGLNKEDIQKLKNSSKTSRWTAYCKAFPCYLVQQKRILTIPYLEKN